MVEQKTILGKLERGSLQSKSMLRKQHFEILYFWWTLECDIPNKNEVENGGKMHLQVLPNMWCESDIMCL